MNAKEELLEILKVAEQLGTGIKCAIIKYEKDFDEVDFFILKVGHSLEEFKNFLNKLDFDYNNGYGGQHIFGTVWLNDNTWLSRGEYDGMEWWVHNFLPKIPKELE